MAMRVRCRGFRGGRVGRVGRAEEADIQRRHRRRGGTRVRGMSRFRFGRRRSAQAAREQKACGRGHGNGLQKILHTVSFCGWNDHERHRPWIEIVGRPAWIIPQRSKRRGGNEASAESEPAREARREKQKPQRTSDEGGRSGATKGRAERLLGQKNEVGTRARA